LPLLKPLLALVDIITPGNPVAYDPAITIHLAMLHTVFNTINTLAFLPFVNQYAKLVSFFIRDDKPAPESEHYVFTSFTITSAVTDTPELNILRVEKEIRDMAGITSSMYSRFSSVLHGLRTAGDKGKIATDLCEELEQKEQYADEMREVLTNNLIEITHKQINIHSEHRVSHLLRVIGYIEEMSDECYSISRLLEKNLRKNCIFKDAEMDELIPYVNQVGQFLAMLQEQLGHKPAAELAVQAVELEESINSSRKKLRKLSRKRIEAGENVRTELFFIELVRRIEKLGDYCMDITSMITNN
jgi:phosphate:Na+ symporter